MSEYIVIAVVVAAFIAAGVLSYLFTPPVKRFAQKIGAIDVPKDNRRMHKEPIPRWEAWRFLAVSCVRSWCSASWTRPCCVCCSEHPLL